MSKHSHSPETEGRGPARQGTANAGDILLAVARQERQRSEIQAKLTSILDSLRASAPGVPPARTQAAPIIRVEPAAAVRARAIELFAEDATEAPVAPQRQQPSPEHPAASLKARLDTLVAFESVLAARAELRRDPGDAPEAAPAAPEVLTGAEAAHPAAPPMAVDTIPAWQVQIERLNARLERVEAASVMAATTLDSLVTSFDTSQQTTFAAAQAGAREEVRSVIAAEVDPALAALRGAASSAHEEIHGVLTLLGTCLERVVGHLQRIEGLSMVALPIAEDARPFEAFAPEPEPEPAGAAIPVQPPTPDAPAPTVPLPGFGRRSKLAALIDFGFGTRAA